MSEEKKNEVLSQEKELSMDELDAVAGGGYMCLRRRRRRSSR